MWTYIPELLATPVPRYTSYPTAAEFRGDVGPADYGAALDAVQADEPLSLYLHIPFCREICWYCGCNTGAANRVSRLAAYLERLEEEVALVAERLGGRGRVGRIAFGGGSPNAVSPGAFLHLVNHIRSVFECNDAVVSVEIDPRGFDDGWAWALAAARASRASLGVQTFSPAIQAAIGRVQPAADIARAVGLLRSAGVGSINFDLMYGLPGQDEAALIQSIDASVALGADRLAVFGYAHVPHLIPRQRRIDDARLPGAAERFAQAATARQRLVEAGYVPVGFDHFARPGDALAQAQANGGLRRNFQGFTEDGAETLVGFGSSAISAFRGGLFQNEKNNGRYHLRIGAGQLATALGLRRSAAEWRRARAIERILCDGQADLVELGELTEVRERLDRFEAAGLVSWTGSVLKLSPDAAPYARSIAATLDIHRGQAPARFSNAV